MHKILSLCLLSLCLLSLLTPRAALTVAEPALSLYAAAYCANSCEVGEGDTFEIVLSLYTTEVQYVSVNPVLPLPAGFEVLSSSASAAGLEGYTWAGVVAFDQPVTIKHLFKVTNALQGSGIRRIAFVAQYTDERNKTHKVIARAIVRGAKRYTLFAPVVKKAAA